MEVNAILVIMGAAAVRGIATYIVHLLLGENCVDYHSHLDGIMTMQWYDTWTNPNPNPNPNPNSGMIRGLQRSSRLLFKLLLKVGGHCFSGF